MSIKNIKPELAIDRIIESIEQDMFAENPKIKLKNILNKLEIKSAKFFSELLFESLEATLNSATYDDTHIKNWKDIKGNKS